MGQAELHQNLELLQAYGVGKVGGAAADTITEHLETCVECRRVVAAAPADRFLSKLQNLIPPAVDSLASAVVTLPPAAGPVAAAVADDPIPQGLTRSSEYEVLREINRGGMGVVYLVRNRRMDRLEGLKVVNEALLQRAGALERFEREMRAAARLNHTNIVAAYSAPSLEGLLAFAMEYVDGIDLHQLVREQGPLSVSNACYYIYQAAQGLQHAHERKMVHRDIKPNNLMLTRDGKKQIIKILDFGLAKATSENPIDGGLTGEGQMLGTPRYMAPEQISDASSADIRADIYSLGCTLYHLLAGSPPFRHKESLYDILSAHHTETAQPLQEIRPDVPDELAAIVSKMMAKDPAGRYQRPSEVAAAMTPFFRRGPAAIASDERSERSAAAAALVAAIDSEQAIAGKNRSRRSEKRGAVKPWLGIAAGVLVAGLLAAWAAGLFKVKMKEGILVIDVNVPNAEVFVDDAKVKVTWGEGGKHAEVSVEPGQRRVKIVKDGYSVAARKLTLREGINDVFTATLVPLEKPSPPAEVQETRPAPPATAVIPPAQGHEALMLLKGHTEIVWGVAFSPDGKRLASGGKDGTVRLWEVDTARQIREIARGNETWRTIAWSPDGKLIAAGGDAAVVLRDAETGAVVGRLIGHTGQIRGLAFSADSSQLVTSSLDHQIKLWNVTERNVLKTLTGHTAYASAVALSRSGRWIASGGWDQSLKLWDGATGEVKFDLQKQPGVGHSVAISRDERLFASATSSGHVRIWNLETGNLERELTFLRPPGRVWAVAFKPDGTALAVGADRLLGLWNPTTGNLIKELSPMPVSGVLSLAWSPDGRLLATGSGDVDGKQDGTIGLWAIGDPLSAGSVWKGKRTYRKGGFAGLR